MHTSSHGLQTPSHSNEVERRLTRSEMSIEAHAARITVLERMLMGVIYAIGALSAGKTGDIVDALLSLLKVKT